MQWRVIIRMGLTHDTKSPVRNTLKPIFEKCGIENTKAGTWESPAAEPVKAAKTLSKILKVLADLAIKQEGKSPHMEYFWVYLDKVG